MTQPSTSKRSEENLVIPIGGNYDVKDILCPKLGLTWRDSDGREVEGGQLASCEGVWTQYRPAVHSIFI